jgi:pilus assembly protein Flp/PilA
MIARIRALVRDEGGATAVEYALIVSAIAGLIIVVVFFLGNKVNNEFSNVASHLP